MKLMDNLTAKQAHALSVLCTQEHHVQMNKIMAAIREHASRGLFTFVYHGELLKKTVEELQELGYVVSNGNDNAYENFWYIKW